MGSSQSTEVAPQNHNRKPTGIARQCSVFLRGCETDEEHKFRKKEMIEMLHGLKGEEGLIACGLEYRLVIIGEDGKLVEETAKEAETNSTSIGTSDYQSSGHEEEKKDENSPCLLSSDLDQTHVNAKNKGKQHPSPFKYMTMTRLFDKDSNTMITLTNRKEFIADGAMYDIVCRQAMEYSQEMMIREGKLEWVLIAEDEVEGNQNPTIEPIRALMSTRLVEDKSRVDKEPTLLIMTGKGRVRAGVFSRQHLLTSGLECGSAVEFVREAVKRNLNVIVFDPNARGDRFAMETFDKSMTHIFGCWEKEDDTEFTALEDTSSPLEHRPQNLYVLSHSQSGAQFQRHLLNRAERYLPHIGAIAFTDSTHNIQWTKRNNEQALGDLLESERCVYFRRTDETTDFLLKPFSSIGKVIDTDDFWKHRFGNIKTICAGTSEHSLTNWFAKFHIWDHYDQYIEANKGNSAQGGHIMS